MIGKEVKTITHGPSMFGTVMGKDFIMITEEPVMEKPSISSLQMPLDFKLSSSDGLKIMQVIEELAR